MYKYVYIFFSSACCNVFINLYFLVEKIISTYFFLFYPSEMKLCYISDIACACILCMHFSIHFHTAAYFPKDRTIYYQRHLCECLFTIFDLFFYLTFIYPGK